MSIFTSVWTWLKKAFGTIENSADSVAISITEDIKGALASGVLGFLANVIDALTKSNIAAEVVSILEAKIPEILAVELAIQGLPANPTQADILTFENAILKAFSVTDEKSKLYTVLAAQIFGIIQTTVNNTPGKFADWVSAVETAYQDYLTDQAGTDSIS